MSPREKNKNEQARQASIQNIANAAAKLFIEVGYLNVTIAQIAKRANISKGLLYNYFSGKEELLEHIIDQTLLEIAEISSQILNTKDPSLKISLILKTTFKILREKSEFWQTVMPVITQKAISEKMILNLTRIFMSLTQDLIQTFKAGGVKNAEMEAYQLAALMDGIALHYFYFYKDEYPLDKLEKSLLTKYSKILKNGQ
ncbi:MAG: TetR/AcrR family transcriptional regulator [Chitinophagaceae bacterium]